MASPRQINTHPNDPHGSDPDEAEAAKFALEHICRVSDYGFDTYLERTAISALAARLGGMVCEYDERIQDLTFRNYDPRRFMLAPGWLDVWDRTWPYAMEQVPMSLTEARHRFQDDTIVADLNGNDLEWPILPDAPSPDRQGPNPEQDPNDEGRVLALVCWSQFDAETEKKSHNLDPADQYPYCPSCGYEGSVAMEPPGTLCPVCLKSPGVAVPMEMALSEDYDLPKYADGRRYEIILPLQLKSVADRGWPKGPNGEQLRFPAYLQLRRFEHPTDYTGLSESTLDAPLQTLSNSLFERARKQVQGPGTIAAVTGKITDGQGNDWQPTDDPFQWAYLDDPSSTVTIINLAQVSSSLFELADRVQNMLRSDLGTTELGANSASDLQGVAGVSIEQAAQSGSVPTDHFIAIANRQLGPFYGAVLDMARIYWTKKRWIRLQGPLGRQSYMLLAGHEFPNADITVSADPENKIMDSKTLDSVQKWYQLGNPAMGGSPELRRALGVLSQVPPSVMNDVEDAEAKAATAQQNAMQATGGAPGMTPPGPEAGVPPGGPAPGAPVPSMGA